MTKIRLLLILTALLVVLALALSSCTGNTAGGNPTPDSSDNGNTDGDNTSSGNNSDTGNGDSTENGDNNDTGTTDPDDPTGDNNENGGTEGTDGDSTEGGGTEGGNTESGDTENNDDDTGSGGTEGDTDEGENEGEEVIDITAFTVITETDATDFVALQTKKLAAAIGALSGTAPTVLTDKAACSAFELNVGKTDRDITVLALHTLRETVEGDGYVIYVTADAIAIAGTTDDATGHAVKVFCDMYVKSADGGMLNAEFIITEGYDSTKHEIINGDAEIEILTDPVTLFQPSGHTEEYGTPIKSTSAHYPSIVVLSHQPNEADNGRLIAHFCLSDAYASTDACFMESTDGGATWKIISRPEEQKSPELIPGRMAHLYELPVQVGNYPAGTLVFSSGSVDYSIRSEIWIWYSTDLGRTWTQEALIAEGGITRDGVWEPFTWYEDGWLYCFYSDETDPAPSDQRLVYKRSRDGVNWSEEVEVCSFAKDNDRPGMFVMTKMGNGQFFMVYEYYGSGGGKVYYKITNDISSWNPEDPGTLLKVGSYSGKGAPSCIWIPAGGECGTLIATAKTEVNGDGTHRMFVSFDYGKTWTTVVNPLPYTEGTDGSTPRIGHSPSFAVGTDGTVYYLNTTDTPETGRRRIQFASFIIY